MSNSFPSLPSDLLLAQIQYTLPALSTLYDTPPVVYGFTGGNSVGSGGISVQVELGNNPPICVIFSFDTPGSFGTFDQTAAETAVAAVVTDICQLMADWELTTLAAIQATVTVPRTWTWTDSAGYSLTYADTMTYPPA